MATLAPPSPTMRRRHRARELLTRLFASTASRPDCPICLDVVPIAGRDGDEAGVSLRCGHQFCRDCVRQYALSKVRDRQVASDQLICPVVECKRALKGRDLRRILETEELLQYRRIRQRIRDENDPLARWCPRADCSELVLCAPGASVFTCPRCKTVGCFHCRGPAHRFTLLCRATPLKSDDAAYLQWEKSVGDKRTVRGCPKCRMRIWKTEGCNHMVCAHCHHEYCWACDARWHRRHYACGEDEEPRSAIDALRRRAAQIELVVVRVIVGLLALASAIVLAPIFALVALMRKVPQLIHFLYGALKLLAVSVVALLALPFLLVLTIYDAFEKPEEREAHSTHVRR